MVLVKKGPFFHLFILGRIGQEIECHDIVKRTNTFLGYKKKVQKVEKLRFFQRGYSMVLVKKGPFIRLFILGHIGTENEFYDILQRRKNFLSYKNKKLKRSKN